MTKKLTFIMCPSHPRASRGGIIPKGMVKASDHGECATHGNVSKPRAGTQAYKDSRGLWIPDGPGFRNIQVEHFVVELRNLFRFFGPYRDVTHLARLIPPLLHIPFANFGDALLGNVVLCSRGIRTPGYRERDMR